MSCWFVWCWLWPSLPVLAEPFKVYYAGLAYIGDHQYIDDNYPLIRQLNTPGKDGIAPLDHALFERLQAIAPQHIELQFGLGNLNQNQTIALAVAVDKERVSREVFAGDKPFTKLIYDVSLQLLFFDMEQQSLIDSYPLSISLNDVIQGKTEPEQKYSLETIRSLLIGKDETGGLFDLVGATLEKVRLSVANTLRFKLNKVIIEDRVRDKMPASFTVNQFQQHLGQYFSKRLSDETQLAVIPFNRGYAVAHQLPGAFANGRAFSLSFPEPDFSFEVNVKNAFSRPVDGNMLFGTQVHFSLHEPFTGETYIADDFRYAVYKLDSESLRLRDDWSAYEDVLENLLDELVGQLKNPNKKWHADHALNASSYNDFKKRKGLFHVK